MQICQNTANTHKYDTRSLWYFLSLQVFYLVYIFWIVLSCSCSNSVYFLILINVPTPFLFLTYEICPKSYIDKSLSLIKSTIIIYECVLDIKDYNEEVLIAAIVEN